MTVEKLDFKFNYADTGFCRIYYKSKQRRSSVFCIQEEGKSHYVMYLCTKDGEPQHPIRSEIIGDIEPAPSGVGICDELNDWLSSNRETLNK